MYCSFPDSVLELKSDFGAPQFIDFEKQSSHLDSDIFPLDSCLESLAFDSDNLYGEIDRIRSKIPAGFSAYHYGKLSKNCVFKGIDDEQFLYLAEIFPRNQGLEIWELFDHLKYLEKHYNSVIYGGFDTTLYLKLSVNSSNAKSLAKDLRDICIDASSESELLQKEGKIDLWWD